MGVSTAAIERHIANCTARYGATLKSRWPSRLFRHEALENAVSVLKSGVLQSRNHASQNIQRDVAPEEIIGNDERAHAYARLYFRPRTPTQYHIEGIRKPGECRYPGKHAPVLYMFVFHSRELLIRQDVRFSNGNMQVNGTSILDGDEGFATLDFDKIYHDGSYNRDNPDNEDIPVWRCAEVLCDSPLVLDESLEAVVCRSHAERHYLLHMLGDDAERWREKIRILTKPGYFNAEYAFVESVDLQADGVHVRFHPRRHLPMEANVKLVARSQTDLLRVHDFPIQSLNLRTQWRFPFETLLGPYLIDIEIDGEAAFKGISTYDPDPF